MDVHHAGSKICTLPMLSVGNLEYLFFKWLHGLFYNLRIYRFQDANAYDIIIFYIEVFPGYEETKHCLVWDFVYIIN